MANILTRIFGKAEAVQAVPAPISTPAQSAPLAPVATGKLDVALDSWERKFSVSPYFENSRKLPSQFYCGNPPKLTKEIMRAVFDRAGGEKIFSKTELEKLADLRKQQDAVAAKLDELGFNRIGEIFRQQKTDAANSLLMTGKMGGQLVGYQAATDAVTQGRQACHLANAELSKQVHAIVAPACAKMKSAARALADELDKSEISAHEKFFPKETGIPFKPSELLRGFIYVALAQADLPVKNFKLTSLLQAPSLTGGVFTLWWCQAPTPVVVDVDKLREQNHQRDVDRNQARLSEQEKARFSARTPTPDELAKKNSLVEKIKAAGAKAQAEKQKADAEREAQNEQRKQKAFDDLQTGK